MEWRLSLASVGYEESLLLLLLTRYCIIIITHRSTLVFVSKRSIFDGKLKQIS